MQAHTGGVYCGKNTHTHSNTIFKTFPLLYNYYTNYSCFGEFWVETI